MGKTIKYHAFKKKNIIEYIALMTQLNQSPNRKSNI